MAIRRESQDRWVGNTLAEFERDLADNLCYQRGTTAESASAQDAYWTLAVTVRDRLADRRARTAKANYEANPKFVYYLSAEYMLGRQLRQNTLYTGTADLARQAVAGSGFSAEELEALDVEPGLGNGGLGRLAACLLDSLATLDMPAVGYGIRYEFGIFKQAFEDGHQVEHPDDWAFYGNPWEFPAPDDLQVVGFDNKTTNEYTTLQQKKRRWPIALAEDVPVGQLVCSPTMELSCFKGTKPRKANLVGANSSEQKNRNRILWFRAAHILPQRSSLTCEEIRRRTASQSAPIPEGRRLRAQPSGIARD